MGSALPKVLHRAAGESLVERVLGVARRVPCERVLVVVGYGAEKVQRHLEGQGRIEWVLQEPQRGTGHALAQVENRAPAGALLLVLSGDAPLVRVETARQLLEAAEETAWGAMAVAEVEDPGSLGRVVVGAGGALVSCVEAADASAEERALRTVNAGFYALPVPDIFGYLQRVRPDNVQRELYLPEALNLAAKEGRRIDCLTLSDSTEAWGVNTPEELRRVEARLLERESGS